MMTEQKRDQIYLPTPAQIRRDCNQVQQTWSERQRLRRQGAHCEPFRVPTYAIVRTSEDSVSLRERDIEFIG